MAKGTLKKMLTVAMALLLCATMMPMNIWAEGDNAQPKDLEIVEGSTEVDEHTVETNLGKEASTEAEEVVDETAEKPAAEPEKVEEAEEAKEAEPAEEGEKSVEELAEEESVSDTTDETAPETESVEEAEKAETTEAAEEALEETSAEEVAETEETQEPETEPVEEVEETETTEKGEEVTEKSKPEETVEEVEEPSTVFPAFSEEKTVSGVKVFVEAEEGVFPEGSKLSVKKVSRSEQKKVNSALEEVRAEDTNVVASYTFDIKVLDKDGQEVQPKDEAKVKVSFELAEADNDNLDTQVYHITEKEITADAVEELTVETWGETVTVETDGFSYYTVEFTYNNLEYVLEGGETVALSEVLDQIGLSGEVTKVSVSNKKLFTCEKEDGVWVIRSLKAFTTTEWMKVTIDGIEYEIVVTDAIPGDTVTGQVDMNNGEEKTGNFTITGGPVRGPQKGTATISGSVVTNQANNTAKGGVSASTGSAFISRTGGNLLFKGTTINTSTKSLVINIWANATAELKSSTLDCSGVEYGSVPFLLIGAYNGANGTLNVSGDSVIKNTEAAIAGGNGGSIINVKDGTLTLKDSKIALKDGIKFVVKSGATLVLDGTVMDVSGCTSGPAIQVEAGGTLIVENKSAINDYNNSNNSAISAKGATVELNDSVFDKNKGLWGGVLLADGCEVTVTDCKFTDNTGKSGGAINAVNGSEINVKGSTFDGNNATVDGGGAIWMSDSTLTVDGASKFNNNIANKQGGAVFAQNSQVTIEDGAAFTENHAGSVEGKGTGIGGALCLNNCTTTIGSATFEKNGTFLPDNFEDDDFDENTGIYTQSGGAIIASNGTLSIQGTTFKENLSFDMTVGQGSGGAIHVTGTTMSIEGATFEDNAGQLYGGAVTLGYNSRAEIADLNGTPTRFEGNTVLFGAEFAGGAICVHGNGTSSDAFLKMENAAIYGNHADGAGGGISTCQQGTSKVLVMDGAAIFDNEVGSSSPVTEAVDKKDVYIFRNGTASQDKSEIYDRMFNGGSHSWDNEEVDVQEKWAGAGTALIGKSNPTNTDVSNAKVIFTGNAAYVHPDESMKTAIVSGGAISNNGLLQIGSDTQIRIYKVWDDNSNKSGHRPIDDEFVEKLRVIGANGEVDLTDSEIEIKVHKSGEFDAFTEFVAATQGGRTEKVTATEDNWIIDITGLPKDGWPYSVYEGNGPGQPCSIYYLPPSDTDPYTFRDYGFFGFKNTYAEGKVVIEAKKEMTGKKLKDGQFEFILVDEDGNEFTATNDGKGNIVFEELVYTLEDLEDYVQKTPELLETSDAEPEEEQEPETEPITQVFEYTIKEVQGDEKYVTYDEHEETVKVTVTYTPGNPELEVVVEYDEDEALFRNEAKKELDVAKVWDDNDDEEGERPSSIKVELYADDELIKTVKLDEENGWSHTFKDLPVEDEKTGEEIKYEVLEESTVDGYEAPKYDVDKENDTVTITNKKTEPEKEYVDIEVAKAWEDEDDADGIRPDSVTINLLANGEKTDNVVKLTADNKWKGKFDTLPKTDDEGNDIEYTIEEVEVKGYTTKVDGNAEEGFTVTNTHKVELTITVIKKWEDEDNQEGIRPEEITVRLMADGEFTGESKTVTEGEDGIWAVAFVGLKKGPVYTVEEETVPGYEAVYEGDAESGFTIINKLERDEGEDEEETDKPEKDDKEKETKPKDDGGKKKKTPGTGDESNPMVYALILSLAAVATTAVYRKRRAK